MVRTAWSKFFSTTDCFCSYWLLPRKTTSSHVKRPFCLDWFGPEMIKLPKVTADIDQSWIVNHSGPNLRAQIRGYFFLGLVCGVTNTKTTSHPQVIMDYDRQYEFHSELPTQIWPERNVQRTLRADQISPALKGNRTPCYVNLKNDGYPRCQMPWWMLADPFPKVPRTMKHVNPLTPAYQESDKCP